MLTGDGRVDGRSKAVRDGRVLLTSSGEIDRRSAAVRSGDLFDRPSTEEGASARHSWTADEKEIAWEKTAVIPGRNPDLYGLDKVSWTSELSSVGLDRSPDCASGLAQQSGNVVYYPSYGKKVRNTDLGWDIDHSKPLSSGGTNHPNNLQALQAYTNRHHKGSKYPYAYDTTLGVTPDPLDVDLRSSTMRNESLYFLPDGTVDCRSAAVRSGDVLVTDDGRVDRRSAAVRRGDLRFKG
jgi:hypothetical protein